MTAANCDQAARGAKDIYSLAADMGGMGFIENNKALCMLTVLINTQMLQAAAKYDAKRFFYSSSACVYNADKQRDPKVTALKEADAYPAMPEDGYGWEKLFSERMCRHFRMRILVCGRGWRGFTMYMGRRGRGMMGREKAPGGDFAGR